MRQAFQNGIKHSYFFNTTSTRSSPSSLHHRVTFTMPVILLKCLHAKFTLIFCLLTAFSFISLEIDLYILVLLAFGFSNWSSAISLPDIKKINFFI